MSTVSKSGKQKAACHAVAARRRRESGKLGSILALAALLLASVLAGCKSPEASENEASRPWNAPRQWETGLPGFNNYERR